MRTLLASKSRSMACPRNRAAPYARRSSSTTTRTRHHAQSNYVPRTAMPTSRLCAALEPFGYYDPKVTPHLTGDEATGWTARFDVVPGDPVIVREEHVDVIGDGKDQRRVTAAIAGFVPKVGERLDHPTYEASKAVIDTSLRGAGYLDAKYTKPSRHGDTRKSIPRKWICSGRAGHATSSATCAFRAMRRSRKNSCVNTCPGAKMVSSVRNRCSTFSSGWWMRTISNSSRCSRPSMKRKTARFPSMCC